jgi:ATP-binding cassette subfamily B protein
VRAKKVAPREKKPVNPANKAKDFGKTLKRLMQYIRPYRGAFTIIFIFAALSSVFSVVGPRIMGQITTLLSESVLARAAGETNGIDMSGVARVMATLFAVYMAGSLMSFATAYILAGTSQRFIFSLRNDVKDKLDRLPLKYFDGRTRGEVLSRITNDVETISNTLQQSLSQIITAIVTLIGTLVMMFIISVKLTLLAFVTLPTFAILAFVIAKASQKYFAGQQKALGELNGHVEEMYTGHKVVRLYNLEESSIDKFQNINGRLFNMGWKANFISSIIYPVLSFVGNLGYVIICIAGGALVAQRILPLGDVQAFMQYTRNYMQPILQVVTMTNTIQATIAAAERVFEVLDESEQTPDAVNPVTVRNAKGAVVFDDVYFRYKDDTPLIENLNIEIASGSTIAIVGPTGAGKTTLVNLIMRFYELNAGEIRLDGVNIANMTREDLRRNIGMVLQDTWLFNGTIFENIKYGNARATEDDVKAAAAAARADHFINTLPDGYDTVINEEATNVSQGQKQLSTIARAMLTKPSIMILDEATSNIDTLTETLVQNAMDEIMKGRTSFVIAHRLSTVKNADKILVMVDGSVKEQGSHQELLSADGYYADLYNSQFAVH